MDASLRGSPGPLFARTYARSAASLPAAQRAARSRDTGAIRAAVKAFITAQGSYGATDREIHAHIVSQPQWRDKGESSTRPRRCDLKDSDEIRSSGQVRDGMTVWVAVECCKGADNPSPATYRDSSS